MWKTGLSTIVRNGTIETPVRFRLLFLQPDSYQIRQIQAWQRQDTQELNDESKRVPNRDATMDWIYTIFVAWRLQNIHRCRIHFDIRFMCSGRFTMTYSLCRVASLAFVTHYNYESLSRNVPATRLQCHFDHPGYAFKEDFQRFFLGDLSHHTIPLDLEKVPTDVTNIDTFRHWIVHKVCTQRMS